MIDLLDRSEEPLVARVNNRNFEVPGERAREARLWLWLLERRMVGANFVELVLGSWGLEAREDER